MDKNQKSVENVGPTQSQSSSSRRVMWKVCDGEEEVYDSVVNYRSLSPAHQSKSPSSSNSEHELPSTSKSQTLASSDGKYLLLIKEPKTVKEAATRSSTSLALRYKPSHESVQELASTKRARAIGCWHHLFDKIRNRKLDIEASPSLAMRYKPSHESLKNRRSKDLLVDSRSTPRSTNSPKPKLATADLKLETCFFPPYQTAVVREVAPKFANRMCIPDDSDSCCSGSIELRIPLLKSSKSSKIATAMHMTALPASTSFFSHVETKNGSSKTKRRTKTPATSGGGNTKGNGSKTTSSGSTNSALPTLRQRQLELHRVRVQIEKRRLELLDLKIVRERADALRHEILFHKDLQLKHNQIKSYEDNNSSQA
ncbi:uncharacterized protein LOC115759567 [Drosophila novamexicana]|uniref:uncharacterized protein LOC115759567 n=1 Tax=Drosophila novamexicana TaxID=47314 RepID=UPI0011E58E59|nr:uncharacterized protein LOC115759567 [Drosophila novamexicana]